MVAHTHAPNIRRIYNRPWRDGGLANPGKIPTCIHVAVRPETTVWALETVFRALAQFSTTRAGLAGVGRGDILDRNPCRFRLVLDKGLKLSPGPAVESRAYALSCLDATADVREVLHHDLGDTKPLGFFDNGLARFVVDVLHAPHLLAGDLPELLFRALAAVGLKTPAQGKVAIALIAQFPAAKDLARARGGEVVFPDIHAHHRAGCHRCRIAGFDDEVEKPAAFAKHQFGFFRLAGFEDATLVFTKAHRDGDAAIQRVERNHLAFDGVGALVEVHAGAVEADIRDRLVFADAPECFLRLVRLAHRVDGVAAHLTAQRCVLPQHRIGVLMQRYPVPDTVFADDRNKAVAGVHVSRAQSSKTARLFRRHIEKDRRRAHHRLSPLGNMLGAPIANRVQHRSCCLGHRSRQDIASILRTPHHTVSGLIDAVAVCYNINHTLKYTTHGALRASVIPPPTEVGGFLAEDL
ncbi:MAG: hypothetical protein KatS3mg087_0040 [Patescibacteria group bacterium]|nr:MAG: hypothetical protein KatS3mg087_0040 [Patescibacteria group bacterium]